MSKLLDDFLGDGTTTFDEHKLRLYLTELEQRITKLENKEKTGGVYIDGSPKYIKDYYENIQKQDEKPGGDS